MSPATYVAGMDCRGKIIACHWCGKERKSDDGKHKLKLCAKCELSGYCNRECQVKDWPFHKTLCRSGLTGELITLKSAGEKVKDAFLPANLWGKDVHAWVMEHRKNLLPLGYLTLGCPDPVEYNARGAAERQVVVIGIERQPDEPLSRRFRIRFHETQREPEAERIYSAGFAKTRLPLQDETADKEDYIVISMVFAQITAKDEMTYFDYAAAWEAGGGLMDLIKRTEDTPDWIWDAVKALIHGESPPSDPPGLKQKIPDDEWIPEELSGMNMRRKGNIMWSGGIEPQNYKVEDLGFGPMTTFTINVPN